MWTSPKRLRLGILTRTNKILIPRHERLKSTAYVALRAASHLPQHLRVFYPALFPLRSAWSCRRSTMSLIIAIFALVFLTELISWVGQSVLLEFVRGTCPSCWCRVWPTPPRSWRQPQAYALYLRIFHSAKVSQQKKLKSDILVTKKELLQTSAQDHFAKWAKLRRSVDKGLGELEKLSRSFSSCYYFGLLNIILEIYRASFRARIWE